MKKPKHKSKKEKKPKRGRPEKPLKIDDAPRNVARTFFGMKSPKYIRPK